MNLPSSNGLNPEVPEKVTRRRYPGEYKKRILEQYETAPVGGRGALLRREGLYSSHIDSWRKQREAGVLEALAPKKRGRKARERNPLAHENAELRRKLARMERKLQQAELIIEIQKKVSEVLGIPLEKPKPDDESE